MTSITNSRVYYLDGPSTVKFLTPDGHTGIAHTIVAPGPAVVVSFAVSADDRRIVVSLMDFSAIPVDRLNTGPVGPEKLLLYAEDLGGGNRVDLFSAENVWEYPIGWVGEDVVIALGDHLKEFFNPYTASEYHVVDPSTGNRIRTIGHPSGANGSECNYGPVVAAGAACANVLGEIGVQDWNGNYRLLYRKSPVGPWELALSPDGTKIANWVEPNNEPIYVGGGVDTHIIFGNPRGWIDDDHLVLWDLGSAGCPVAIYEMSTKTVYRLKTDITVDCTLTGFAGSFPGTLD